MKTTSWGLILLLSVASQLLLTACNEPRESDLEQLVTMMTGSFSSQAQAKADTNFLDIRLEMKPIWTDRADVTEGHYLYVEQAAGWALDKP